MAKVKIGDKEYKLGPLNAFDLDEINEDLKGKKLSELKKSFNIYLYAIKKYNDDVKMDLKEFMLSFPLDGMEEKTKEINKVTGINFTAVGRKS